MCLPLSVCARTYTHKIRIYALAILEKLSYIDAHVYATVTIRLRHNQRRYVFFFIHRPSSTFDYIVSEIQQQKKRAAGIYSKLSVRVCVGVLDALICNTRSFTNTPPVPSRYNNPGLLLKISIIVCGAFIHYNYYIQLNTGRLVNIICIYALPYVRHTHTHM